MVRELNRMHAAPVNEPQNAAPSELVNWPVQLALVPPNAPTFRNADLLLVADCVPFAFADFHRRLLRGKPVIVGCPKLDDAASSVEKLAQIIACSNLRSLTVVHMEVPCCSGLVQIAGAALTRAGVEIPARHVTVGIQGDLFEEGSEIPADRRAIPGLRT